MPDLRLILSDLTCGPEKQILYLTSSRVIVHFSIPKSLEQSFSAQNMVIVFQSLFKYGTKTTESNQPRNEMNTVESLELFWQFLLLKINIRRQKDIDSRALQNLVTLI